MAEFLSGREFKKKKKKVAARKLMQDPRQSRNSQENLDDHPPSITRIDFRIPVVVGPLPKSRVEKSKSCNVEMTLKFRKQSTVLLTKGVFSNHQLSKQDKLGGHVPVGLKYGIQLQAQANHPFSDNIIRWVPS